MVMGNQRRNGGDRVMSSSSTKRGNNVSKTAITRKSKVIPYFDRKVSELSTKERCELIAELSEAILEDPRSAFTSSSSSSNSNKSSTKSKKKSGKGKGEDGGDEDDTSYLASHSKMKRLLELANLWKGSGTDDYLTSRLATLSLLAVFQDILPSYRIRLPTAAERNVRVAKETKQLWDFERSLLQSYQQYLNILNAVWEAGYGSPHSSHHSSSQLALSVSAILCLCELLKSSPHFNFRSNILATVVRHMTNSNAEVSASCCASVAYVFKTDAQGEIALEATRLLSKLIKDRQQRRAASYTIPSTALRTFLSLPLRVHEDEAQAAKLAASANNKKRKRDRDKDAENEMAVDSKGLDEDMKEGQATLDKIVLARSQADTLHLVVLTYFRILKGVDDILASFSDHDDGKAQDSDEDANPPTNASKGINKRNQHRTNRIDVATQLLAPALEGLAKFAHLINFDTVVDLLKVLKGLLKHVDLLPLDSSLNCVLTAFETLQGPGRELQIDQKEYVNPLYTQLARLATTTNDNLHTTQLALKCLYVAFIKRKEYSTIRVAAFIHRIHTVTLHTPPQTSAPLLAFTRQLLQRYPSTRQLLENEQDVIASGTYSPDVEDSEHANPFAKSSWELGNLRFALDPAVLGHAAGAAEGRMLALPAEEPGRICEEMGRNWRECYIAYRVGGGGGGVGMKRHPLACKKGNDGSSRSKRRRRQQVRFITPRNTDHLKDFRFLS